MQIIIYENHISFGGGSGFVFSDHSLSLHFALTTFQLIVHSFKQEGKIKFDLLLQEYLFNKKFH